MNGATDRSKDDLERRTIEAVRLHRELLRNAEHHHSRWRKAAESSPDMDELRDLHATYLEALFEAQAQQRALSMLIDQLGRVPVLSEDDDLPD